MTDCGYCGKPVQPFVTLEPSIIDGNKEYHIECYEKKYCVTIRGFKRQLGLKL